MFRFLIVLIVVFAPIIGCGDDDAFIEDYVPEYAGASVRYIVCDDGSIKVRFSHAPLITHVKCLACSDDDSGFDETFLHFVQNNDLITFKPCVDLTEERQHIYLVRWYGDEVLFYNPCDE